MLGLLHDIIDYTARYFLKLVVHPVVVNHVQGQVNGVLRCGGCLGNLGVRCSVVAHSICEILLNYFIDHFQGCRSFAC